MNSRLSLALLVALSGGVITSCNSDDSQYEVIEDTTVSNVSLTAFSLEQNSKVAANLDSLFFTVDLNKGRVFNADSLPVGTTQLLSINLSAWRLNPYHFHGD